MGFASFIILKPSLHKLYLGSILDFMLDFLANNTTHSFHTSVAQEKSCAYI